MDRDADPAVIDAMRQERAHHEFMPGWTPARCSCGWRADPDLGARHEWKEWGRHVEERVLATALAVTACTTCGNKGGSGGRLTNKAHPEGIWEHPCPVCHGDPPRRLRWADETRHAKNRDCARTDEVLENYRGRALAAERALAERNEGESSASPMWTDTDRCQAMRDGDCNWPECPQNRDGEPMRSGRHCPLDTCTDED